MTLRLVLVAATTLSLFAVGCGDTAKPDSSASAKPATTSAASAKPAAATTATAAASAKKDDSGW